MILFKNKTYTEDFPFLAIGDIHDETSQLKRLLFHISNSVHRDYHLIFLGDYFGGTQRLGELLRLLRSIKDRSDFIIGNHDLEFISLWKHAIQSSSKKEKFLNYFNLSEEEVHWFISTLVANIETPQAFLSHAGIDDNKSLDEQSIEDLTSSCYRSNLDHVTDKFIIQGHLPMDEVTTEGNHIFVDTGCGYGGYLSAYIFPEHIVINNKHKVGQFA